MPVTSARFDIAVIGGGIVALSIARELSQRLSSHTIALVESERHEGQASAASGAMLSGFSETTEYMMASRLGKVKAAWRREAASQWEEHILQLSDSLGRSIPMQRGTVVIENAMSGPLDQRNFNAILQLLEAEKEEYEPVDKIADFGFRPTAHDRPMRCIFLPNEAYVNSRLVLASLRQILFQSGTVHHFPAKCNSVDPARSSGAPEYIVDTSVGSLTAKVVVIASGALSLRLLQGQPDLLNAIPPLVCGVGSSLVCAGRGREHSLTHAVRTPNRAFACGLHVLPFSSADVYIGATNNVRPHPHFEALLGDIQFLIDCASHQVDRGLSSFVLDEVRTGNRPIAMDGFPLLGETRMPGLWLATGTYRDGFLLSPLIAERLCDAILEGKSYLENAEDFVPERRPIAISDPELAIREGIENYFAIACERGVRMPAVGAWQDDLLNELERRVRQLYSVFPTHYLVPPDFLWDMEQGDLMPQIRSYAERCSC